MHPVVTKTEKWQTHTLGQILTTGHLQVSIGNGELRFASLHTFILIYETFLAWHTLAASRKYE